MGGGVTVVLALLAAATAAADPPSPGKGESKIGDSCTTREDCIDVHGVNCTEGAKGLRCTCTLDATNQVDKCGPKVGLNESCTFTEQCTGESPVCKDGRCGCLYDMRLTIKANGQLGCEADRSGGDDRGGFQGDPAMIIVLVCMAIMFIIICIVLRLFSKARWRENRTIFNTPNPRLMNVSLLRDTKQTERRGSKGSNHPPPSRQPSLASLRPQSPANHSQGSRASLRGSRSSSGSAKSPTAPHHQPPQA